ncbi:MAG: hypothetical protein WDO73_06310 [Ignavibacteriota bacterium]
MSVAVISEDGRKNPQVLPAQFHLSESGHQIWSYRVVEKPAPGPISVLFLFPRKRDASGTSWDQGALGCLHFKRGTDLWSSLPYSEEGDPRQQAVGLELPTFISDAAEAARRFQETPRRRECTGFWRAIERGALPDNSAPHCPCHMIVVAPQDAVGESDSRLIAALQKSRTTVQVLSAVRSPDLEEFCRRVDGRFEFLKESSPVEEAVSRAYLSLLARWEIRYSGAADAQTLKLRVSTPAGWGETIVEL